MNKLQLKKVIKPLIKECLTEILMQEGLIKIIKEHNSKEEQSKQYINENSKKFVKKLTEESKDNKQEVIKEFKKNITPVLNGFDPFAGTANIEDLEAENQKGVNIDNLFSDETINSWNQQMGITQRKS